MLDLSPATAQLARIVTNVRDDQLDDPTPCVDMRVRDVIDHVDGFAQAFSAAATKTQLPGDNAPQADGSRLGTDWRERVPARLEALAAAWRDPAAWHGWDLATATGQGYDAADDLVREAVGFVQPLVEQNPNGIPGLFGPAVKVPGDAPAFEQLLGLTGRDSAWTPADG